MANDLNISLDALSFFAPGLESDRLSVLVPAEDCGVDRPDAFSSVLSLSFVPKVAAGLLAGFSAGLDAGFAETFEELAAAGGAYFAVLLCSDISLIVYMLYETNIIP